VTEIQKFRKIEQLLYLQHCSLNKRNKVLWTSWTPITHCHAIAAGPNEGTMDRGDFVASGNFPTATIIYILDTALRMRQKWPIVNTL
jgi:hypothetical protein